MIGERLYGAPKGFLLVKAQLRLEGVAQVVLRCEGGRLRVVQCLRLPPGIHLLLPSIAHLRLLFKMFAIVSNVGLAVGLVQAQPFVMADWAIIFTLAIVLRQALPTTLNFSMVFLELTYEARIRVNLSQKCGTFPRLRVINENAC